MSYRLLTFKWHCICMFKKIESVSRNLAFDNTVVKKKISSAQSVKGQSLVFWLSDSDLVMVFLRLVIGNLMVQVIY